MQPTEDFLSLALDPVETSAPPLLFALKHGDTFLVVNALGDILGNGDGLFQDDTRVLSRFRLRLGGRALSLLGSAVSQDNVFFTANLTNRPLPLLGGNSTPEGVIHVERKRFLWETRLYERIALRNFADVEAVVPLTLSFEADFHDMFEVRGASRQARGNALAPRVTADSVVLQYQGLDGVARLAGSLFQSGPLAWTRSGRTFRSSSRPGVGRRFISK